jgi:cystathionine gamma-synthase
MNIETLAIHATQLPDANAGAVATPIYLSTTFERAADGSFPHDLIYARMNNPNRELLEKSIAALEGGEVGLAFASGMAAITAVLQTLQTDDHILLPNDAYYTTILLTDQVFGQWGLSHTCIDMSNLQAVEQEIRPNTKLIWIETPSNPQLKLSDIESIANIAQKYNILVAVDNTWATPLIQRPLELGADIVMHATTKYFGGHSDVLGGALVLKTKNALADKLKSIQKLTGAVPSPFDCWLVTRGIKTLAVRVKAQSESAEKIANFLSQHPEIAWVNYPTLPNNPQLNIAQKQMKLGGAMMSILVKGNEQRAVEVAAKLKIFIRATSLGGVESLVEHRKSVEGPTSISPENLLRLSIGLEHPDDLMADLAQALESR